MVKNPATQTPRRQKKKGKDVVKPERTMQELVFKVKSHVPITPAT